MKKQDDFCFISIMTRIVKHCKLREHNLNCQDDQILGHIGYLIIIYLGSLIFYVSLKKLVRGELSLIEELSAYVIEWQLPETYEK